MTPISLDEFRQKREQERLEAERDDADRVEALAQARALLARYSGSGALEELDKLAEADAGVCDDCKLDSDTRWRLGRFGLCRLCASQRLWVAGGREGRSPMPDRLRVPTPAREPARKRQRLLVGSWKCRLCKRGLQVWEAPAAGERPFCDECLRANSQRSGLLLEQEEK